MCETDCPGGIWNFNVRASTLQSIEREPIPSARAAPHRLLARLFVAALRAGRRQEGRRCMASSPRPTLPRPGPAAAACHQVPSLARPLQPGRQVPSLPPGAQPAARGLACWVLPGRRHQPFSRVSTGGSES
jgi:hypothetical protein